MRSRLSLALLLLGLLSAFPISTVNTAGTFQERKDAAAYNELGLELSRAGKIEGAVAAFKQGEERASYYSMEEVLKLLRKIDVRLFAISLAKAEQYSQKLNENQLQRSVDLLTKLAHETGGQAFFPKSLPELQTQVKQMMTLIRSEYVLEYKASGSVGAGTYRRVSVNIVPKPGREAWRVLTRPGYLVAEKPPER